jgi:O-antigen ligase
MLERSLSYHQKLYALIGIGTITLLALLLGIGLEFYPLFVLPLVVLVGYFAIFDFQQVYYLLLFCIPLTTQIHLSGAYALDVPGELLLLLLTLIYPLYLMVHKKFPKSFIAHPLIQILILHILWIGVSVLFAYKQFIALKFFLAKIWFVIPFVFVTALFIKNLEDFKKLFWVILIPLLGTIALALFNQYQVGFNFDAVNRTVKPFYHNHVNYAAVLTIFLPFVWIGARWYPKQTLPRYFLLACRIIFIIAIIYSYTRGAWLSLMAGLISLLALQKRFVSWLFVLGFGLLIALGVHFVHNNKYLDYAPEYKKAVYHANISSHLEATVNIEDVSTAERFFRWIGGVRMSTEHPVTGFGPNNFYHYYRQYTVTAFTTYVSDNPEKSGVHNYFLMTVIEQGFVGLILFMALTLGIFYYGTQLYRKLRDKYTRQLVAALLVSLVAIYIQILLSDLIEAFKIGSFFFINLAVLVNLDLQQQQIERKTAVSE